MRIDASAPSVSVPSVPFVIDPPLYLSAQNASALRANE
jgi:hypothetical protein